MNKIWIWIWVVVAVVALGGLGFLGYNTFYQDSYTQSPGIVYDNGGDGHPHDHGYYGVK